FPSLFFFQAEDGIRDRNVTGVQTCALPISYAFLNDWTIRYLVYYFFSRVFCLTLITITNTTNRDNNPTTNGMNPQLNPVSSRITNTPEDSRSTPIRNSPILFFLIVSYCNKPLSWTSSVSSSSSISTECDSLSLLMAI